MRTRTTITCVDCLRKIPMTANRCVCGFDPCEESGVLKSIYGGLKNEC